jgi:putative Mn2+ efflux pump MntP
MIGMTTAVFSAAGVLIGNVFGCRYKSKAEFTGGIILIAMGLKILITHLVA